MDGKQANLKAVPDDPRFPRGRGPAAEDVRVAVDNPMGWETLSMAMASNRALWPPWFAMEGGGRARLLYYGERFGAEGGQEVELVEPTSRGIERLLRADTSGDKGESIAAMCLLMREMIVAFHGFAAVRPFRVAGKAILRPGDSLPTPEALADLVAEMQDRPKVDEVVREYLEAYLPSKLRAMIHTAAFIMATPDLGHLMRRGEEKRTVENVAEEPAAEAADVSSDPRSGGA